MSGYIIQAVIGAVIGYVGNYLPFLKNHQSSITNAILGVVGSVGGNAAVGQTDLLSGLGMGGVVGLLGGKLFGNKG